MLKLGTLQRVLKIKKPTAKYGGRPFIQRHSTSNISRGNEAADQKFQLNKSPRRCPLCPNLGPEKGIRN
jgi:hypothetical protein